MAQENKIHYCDISISQADYEITDSEIVIYNVPISGEIVQFYSEENFTGNMFKPMDELIKASVLNVPITFMHPKKLLKDHSTKEVANLTNGMLRKPSTERKSYFNDKKVYADMIVKRGSIEASHLENNLMDNKPVDVSIGFSTKIIDKKGTYDGKSYEKVQTQFEYDHLAVLINGFGDIYSGRAGTSQGYGIGMDHNTGIKMADNTNQKLMDAITKRSDELVGKNATLKAELVDAKSKLSDVDSIKTELADAKEKLKDMDSLNEKLQTYQDAEAQVLQTMKEGLKKKYPSMEKLFDDASADTIKAQYKDMKTQELTDPKKSLNGSEAGNKDILTDMDLFEIQKGKKKIEDIK